MERQGLRIGHLVALAGAVATAGALWLPWYHVHLGAAGRAGFELGLGGVPAPFAAFAAGLYAQIDGMAVSGWDVFGRLDIALAVGTGLVTAVVLAAAGGTGSGIGVEPGAAARAAGAVGLALGALVGYRMVDPPAPSGILVVGPGAWTALAGCALMALGGAAAARAPRSPRRSAAPTAAPSGPPRVAGASTPPPRAAG